MYDFLEGNYVCQFDGRAAVKSGVYNGVLARPSVVSFLLFMLKLFCLPAGKILRIRTIWNMKKKKLFPLSDDSPINKS